MTHRRQLLALLVASGCTTLDSPDDELRAATLPVDDDESFCDEPVVSINPAFAVPTNPGTKALLEGSLTADGKELDFGTDVPTEWIATFAQELGRDAVALKQVAYVDLVVRGKTVRVVNKWTRTADRNVPNGIVLDIGALGFGDVELAQTLKLYQSDAGDVKLDLASLEVVDAAGSPVTGVGGDFDLAAPPTSCAEEALVRFGPIPWNMPEFHLPNLDSCSYSECVMVNEGWLRAHHHAWRINQMMEILAGVDSLYRSFLWGQPGLDENWEQYGFTGGHTSPKYYFGDYDDERFSAIREAIAGMWLSLYFGGVGGHAYEFKCKDTNGGWYGSHLTLGKIWLSDNAFSDAGGVFENDQDAVTHTMMHELMHWRYVDLGGLTMLVDTQYHAHGNACVQDGKSERHYGIGEIRHLATYEALDHEDCNHRDKAVRAVDAYALFGMAIGEMVRDGQLAYWPKHADPTPQPPECSGAPGCLCDEVPDGADSGPDGDGGPDLYCEDNEGEATCQLTEVNASDIVGICKLCDDVRGPGCSCDEQLECDVGVCFGADTQGGGVGQCYRDPPPSYQCLADCSELFNDDYAWCFHDLPSGPRCMDYFCDTPTATECDEQGLVCRENECIEECGYVDEFDLALYVSCQDVGYPGIFECNDGRCEVP